MMNISSFTGGLFQTNGYLLEMPGGTLLVDAPEGVADWLKAEGKSIDALLLTHLHYDHVVDVARLKAETSCEIYAHSPVDADLTLETLLREMIGPSLVVSPFVVDVELAGRSTLELFGGKAAFELRHLPGHSPDSLGYLWRGETGQADRLFGGDVLMAGGVGRTDFPHGDAAALRKSLREGVMTLPDATEVWSGHGPLTTVGEERAGNPYLAELD